MFILRALPKFTTVERKKVHEWMIQYLNMEFTICWKSLASGGRLGDENVWEWDCSLIEGASIWLQDWFPTFIISTWDDRFHRSGFDSALKTDKIGCSWTSAFDLSRWGGVKVDRVFLSVCCSMFLSTRSCPDFKWTNSDAMGLLGSNTRVVLT